MTHSHSTFPPFLNSYFKPKTQRLEICKSFWKGHSISWTSGNILFEIFLFYFFFSIRKVFRRQVQPVTSSDLLSAEYQIALQDAQFSFGFLCMTQPHVLSRWVFCIFPNNTAIVVTETFPPALSIVLVRCRLICWFQWPSASINSCNLCAYHAKGIISYFLFALLTCSLYHAL